MGNEYRNFCVIGLLEQAKINLHADDLNAADNCVARARLFIREMQTDDDLPGTDNGTRCSICGSRQFWRPSGLTCENGHGGAEPMEDIPA